MAHPVETTPAKAKASTSTGGSGRKKKNKDEPKDSEDRNVEDKTVLTVNQDSILDQQIEAKAIRFLDVNSNDLEVHEYADCNPVALLSVRLKFPFLLFCRHITLAVNSERKGSHHECAACTGSKSSN